MRSHFSYFSFCLYRYETQQRDALLYLWGKGKTFNQIADWLNERGHKTPRGKRFAGAHAHSIVKKKRMRDKRLEREYTPIWSDFFLETVDKTLVMSDCF